MVRLRLIGDVIFTTPAIRALKRSGPDAHLTYLVEHDAAPVLAQNPHLDDLITIRRRQGLGRALHDVTLARRLRAARFDLVIDFHGGPRSGWLTWATGASTRIGYGIPYRRWAYTRTISRPRQLRARHSVENQWDLLAPLGGRLAEPPDRCRDAVEMPEAPAAAVQVERRLAAVGVGRDHALIVMHASAGNPFRRWPPESFVEVITTLAASNRSRRFVVTSGPSDAGAAAEISRAARDRLGDQTLAVIEAEEFGLAELRSLIGRATLFIGGDSGPLHVAATTQVPIVGIYGPTLSARSAPWRDPACVNESVDTGELPCRPCDQRRCQPGDFRCLTEIRPAAVVAAAERALER